MTGAVFQMHLQLAMTQELPAALKHHIDIVATPVQVAQRTVVGNHNFIAIDMQAIDALFHRTDKAPVGAVITGQVGDGVQVSRLVNGNNAQLLSQERLIERPQYTAANTAITIDRQSDHQSMQSSTAATTASAVMPKNLNSSPAGADSPKLSIPTMRPSRPTYLYQ